MNGFPNFEFCPDKSGLNFELRRCRLPCHCSPLHPHRLVTTTPQALRKAHCLQNTLKRRNFGGQKTSQYLYIPSRKSRTNASWSQFVVWDKNHYLPLKKGVFWYISRHNANYKKNIHKNHCHGGNFFNYWTSFVARFDQSVSWVKGFEFERKPQQC